MSLKSIMNWREDWG